jgi:glycosyltransferase involved in cell wall biosynthesis
MRVLFVLHYPVFGGPHNQALLLARALTRRGVSLTVVLPLGASVAVERLEEAGVDVVTIPLHRVRATLDPVEHLRLIGTLPGEVQALRDVIRTTGVDIVQIGGLVNPHGAIAARLERAAVVWQLLDTRPPMPFRRLMMPLVLRLADVLMSTGATVAHAHPGAEGFGDRLYVFFPPVDTEAFTPGSIDRGAARASFGLKDGDVVLGTVGNLNPQKGHEYLLRCAALTRRVRNDVRVLLVGASHETHRAYERRLHELAGRLGLAVGRDVIFTGGLADVRPALASMDLFVLSSVPRSEGAPTVVEEAMTMQLPVVASDVGAVGELVEDGVTGFVVPPLSPEAASAAILRLLADPGALRTMGSRARDRAVMRFSAEECARVHFEAYEDALRHRQRDGGSSGRP